MTDMREIARRVPIDVTARRVTSRGVHFDSTKRWNGVHSETPLPTAPCPRGCDDLSGRVIGRLTVVGYFRAGSSGATWVVRCVCGMYEVRRGSSIRNTAANSVDRCDRCRQLAYLQDREWTANRQP